MTKGVGNIENDFLADGLVYDRNVWMMNPLAT